MKTKLSVIDYAMALRLRDVNEGRKPQFQVYAETVAKTMHPDTYAHVERAHGTRTLLCDRCMGKETVLPKGYRVWSIQMFQMCLCDSCADEVRCGGPALLPGYFEAARALLKTFFTKVEVERFVADDDTEAVIRTISSRWHLVTAGAPPDSPAKRAPFTAYLPGIFGALHALQEEKLLPAWAALPMGVE